MDGKQDVTDAWARYAATRGVAERNVLVEHYMFVVEFHAARVFARVQGQVQLDDLASAGVFGLVGAVERFDAGRGLKFETFAAQRVRGAIFDEIRAVDWAPRLTRSREKARQATAAALANELNRPPTDREVARRMKLSEAEFAKVGSDWRAPATESLAARRFSFDDGDRDVTNATAIPDRRVADPSAAGEVADRWERLLAGLSRDERMIVVLYYRQDMNMKEIGAALGISESRVSQKHASIVARLKSKLTAPDAPADWSAEWN